MSKGYAKLALPLTGHGNLESCSHLLPVVVGPEPCPGSTMELALVAGALVNQP